MTTWKHEREILEKHGVSIGEWAILISAGYYIPLSRDRFLSHAVFEYNDPIKPNEVADGLESCLNNRWASLTPIGHIENERNIFGQLTGVQTEYPKDGVVLTERGHMIHRMLAFEIHGEEYFGEELLDS